MLKKILIALTLSLLVLIGSYAVQSAKARNRGGELNQKASDAPTGTLQKMIVENGSVTMDLDVSRLNGAGARPAAAGQNLQAHFAVGANSFFPVLVFNDQLRGPVPGSMALIPQNVPALPSALGASLKQLAVEKLPSGQGFDLAVRDSNTGFTFFNIEGHQYDYNPAAQSLAITNGKLLISKELANAMDRPADAGAIAGTISIGAVMQPIQVDQLVNGETKSMALPPVQHAAGPGVPNLVPGPDVIVGDVEDVAQFDPPVGTQVGLAIGTDSCNNGDQPVDWFALPQTDHPLVPQNLYRMSGGATNDERFEQIGQSWMKHTFLALEDFVCGNCNTSGCQTGTHLCPGCSDPYVSGLNGDQNQIGSRAWVNPFTGSFPSNANDHSGHVHDGVSHRILVETNDLIPGNNPGATYYGEAAYISPHEYTWCQSHPTECNMFNNYSHRRFSVTGGPTNFSFPPVGSTVRMQAAIQEWVATGATVVEVEPDPGNDGKFFVGYKVTGPNAGVWHYEYAVFNENLDRAIESFQVSFGFPLVQLPSGGFHAPPQHPGWAHDGTVGDAGYSSTPWTFTIDSLSATWNTETFAENPNANAIRWGTLYNFRLDSSYPPLLNSATIGFFKTGSPITVQVLVPFMSDATPTVTPTPSPTASPTVSPTPTPTVSPTPTPTSTPRPTPTPREPPAPRERPTPHPRP